jgi:hypothetical protein
VAPEQIKHFLVVYDIPAGRADVREFGTDYSAALRAYDAVEEAHRDDPDHEVVLLGSDSLETLKRRTRATSTSATARAPICLSLGRSR